MTLPARRLPPRTYRPVAGNCAPRYLARLEATPRTMRLLHDCLILWRALARHDYDRREREGRPPRYSRRRWASQDRLAARVFRNARRALWRNLLAAGLDPGAVLEAAGRAAPPQAQAPFTGPPDCRPRVDP